MLYIDNKLFSYIFLQAALSFYTQDLGDTDIVEICSKIRAKDDVVRPSCFFTDKSVLIKRTSLSKEQNTTLTPTIQQKPLDERVTYNTIS